MPEKTNGSHVTVVIKYGISNAKASSQICLNVLKGKIILIKVVEGNMKCDTGWLKVCDETKVSY